MGVMEVFATGGVAVRAVVSTWRLRSARAVGSLAADDFCMSRGRNPSGPRPAFSPTARLISANKNISAATCSPDNSRIYERDEEFSTRFGDHSALSARTFGPKPGAKASWSTPIWRSSTKSVGFASRIGGVTSSVGRDAACEFSSGAKCWSCSETTLLMGSSETLSRVSGKRLWTGAGVKPPNSEAGFSDAIQFAI